jgi:hypothetical protein
MTSIRAVAVALGVLGLGGCHLVFGHDPGAPTPRDGQARERGPFTDGAARDRSGLDHGSEGGAGCDPSLGWCKDPSPTSANLYDVSGSDDGSLLYAVGEGVVLSRRDAGWSLLGPPTSIGWRGVHVAAGVANLVGNDQTKAVVYQAVAGTLVALAVDPGPDSYELRAVFAASGSGLPADHQGFVAGSKGTGQGAVFPIVGGVLRTAESIGQGVNSLDGFGDLWAVGNGGAVALWSSAKAEWSWRYDDFKNPLTNLRGVSALGLGGYCACGDTGLTGFVGCCTILGCAHLDLGAPLHDLAVRSSGIWAVGEQGTLLAGVFAGVFAGALPSVTASTPAGKGVTLRAVWVNDSSTGPWHAWVVGDGGTILHRIYKALP